MSQPQPLVNAKPAVQLLIGQLMASVFIVIVAQQWGSVACYSAAFGAGIAVIGSAYFAWQAFRFHNAGAPKQMLRGFYRGLIGKLILIVMGFALVFRLVHPLSAGALFVSFALIQVVAWISPLWLARHG